MPFYQVARSVPSNVAHIAYDKENGLYLAYNRDGSLYGTYSADAARDVGQHKRDDGASCVNLSVDEVKTRQYSGPYHGLFNWYACEQSLALHRLISMPQTTGERAATKQWPIQTP